MANADPFYMRKRWKTFRKDFLDAHPHCSTPGCPSPATEVDHIVSRAKGGADYDVNNSSAVCKSCHSRKSAMMDGSFGRARRHGPPPTLRARGCDADGNPYGGWGNGAK